ncbi:MAG TPA: hypothetical protein VEJ47_02865 [Candidatus Eremiobacteraceae bacterium]|nr:hypothetical protein [Candidatus Eremiobacteraceae bacterium]
MNASATKPALNMTRRRFDIAQDGVAQASLKTGHYTAKNGCATKPV